MTVKSNFYKFQLTLFLSVFVASIPLSFHVYYTASAERETVREAVKLNTVRIARILADEENKVVESSRKLLSVLAQSSIIYDSGASCSNFLTTFLKENLEYINLKAIDVKGNVLCSALPFSAPINVADRTYFQQVMQTKTFNVGEYIVGRISHQPFLELASPVFGKDGEVKYVVSADLSLSFLSKLIKTTLPNENVVDIIDSNGIVLARYPAIEDAIGRVLLRDPVMQDVLLRREGTVETIGLDGVSRLYTFTPLSSGLKKRGAAFLIVGIPTKIVFDKVNQDTIHHIEILVFSELAMFLIMWFAGKIIFRRFVAENHKN